MIRITYIASSGNAYDLNTKMIHTKEANYHAWEFSPIATELLNGERVSAFRKKSAVYTVTLMLYGSETRRRALITALEDDFERDIMELKPGRIIYGNWSADCYIKESNVSPVESTPSRTIVTIGIYIPSGTWTRSESRIFNKPGSAASEFLDFEYDFDYDYKAPEYGSDSWVTDAPFASEFEMMIYGPCVNPRVTINDYPYVVYVTVRDGETLVINSKQHTVMIGEENHFDDRNKSQSVFEKIPAGMLDIKWGDFAFKLTILEERSSPKWS